MRKHIDIQYHFVLDMVKDDKVKLVEVETLINIANSIANVMSIEKFRCCLESLGLMTPNNYSVDTLFAFLRC